MGLIDRLDKRALTELLGKCWMTHDGMWFYHAFSEFGIEKANQLNKLAIQSLAPIEVRRFKKLLNISKPQVESFEELQYFFANVADVLIPDFMNVVWTFPENNVVHWEFNAHECFAYKGIKMLGMIDEYECGPLFRIQCWLRELGVRYEIVPKIDTCIFPINGACSGHFKVFLNQKTS